MIKNSGVNNKVCLKIGLTIFKYIPGFSIGKLGMVIDSFWFEPGSDSTADKEAAERTLQFHVSSRFTPLVGDQNY